MKSLVTAAAALAALSDPLAGGMLTASQLQFELQKNVEPWETSSCKHAPAPNENPYDWDVECSGDAGSYRFRAHVALTRYGAKYELLYWLTDLDRNADTSVTQWIHLKNESSPVVLYETALGVRNDLAALKLTIRNAGPR